MHHSDRGVIPRPSVWKFIKSYAPDWIISLALWLFFYTINHHVSGFKREFSLDDTSLRYPYAVHQRVGSAQLFYVSALVPFLCQIVINVVTVRSWWDLHHSMLGLLLSIVMTGAITQVVKVTVGRPRPDVISRCNPLPGTVDPPFGLSSVAICTQTSMKILDDGWKSFPSGHSSMAFAGLGFLSFYLAGKLHLFDTRGHASKAWLSLTPLCGAALVAISRTMDYRHHWQDVVTGSALGLSVSFFAYRQYYPSLISSLCHRPYRTRFMPQDSAQNDSGRLPAYIDNGGNDSSDERVYRDEQEESEVGLLNGVRKSNAGGSATEA